ncbi:hypothetical protein SCLCIDRAFT_31928 [Scleroderma citrinum Foug A]|uniref:Uncharacterized protein n=1 Tax=Scleroderma citrinum Foug A TaxID=1036808 RepID=A0A0C2YUQ0_9AGAM|nr:hypothetical protein SCLCIDRAFT_31928 [Scleroderma citrinum Foug A]
MDVTLQFASLMKHGSNQAFIHVGFNGRHFALACTSIVSIVVHQHGVRLSEGSG